MNLNIDVGDILGIGGRLKEERLKLGLNQTEFSERLGITKNTQYSYERDLRSPDVGYLLRAREIFGVDIIFVMTGQRSATDIEDSEREILDYYRRLDDSDRQLAKRTIAALAGVLVK